MRLIDADEALKALGEAPLVWNEYTDEYELGQQKQWEQDVEAIKALPTIEAEPVRHGWWAYPFKKNDFVWCECSVCGAVFEICGGRPIDYNYCPECGAKMDGGEE